MLPLMVSAILAPYLSSICEYSCTTICHLIPLNRDAANTVSGFFKAGEMPNSSHIISQGIGSLCFGYSLDAAASSLYNCVTNKLTKGWYVVFSSFTIIKIAVGFVTSSENANVVLDVIFRTRSLINPICILLANVDKIEPLSSEPVLQIVINLSYERSVTLRKFCKYHNNKNIFPFTVLIVLNPSFARELILGKLI